MAISFRIDPGRNTVYTTIEGNLFDTDLVAYIEDLMSHPDFAPDMFTLVHCHDVGVGGISTGSIRRFAEVSRGARDRVGQTRIAIAADQPVVYGLIRMYQAIRSADYEVRVFRNITDASNWLFGETENEPAS